MAIRHRSFRGLSRVSWSWRCGLLGLVMLLGDGCAPGVGALRAPVVAGAAAADGPATRVIEFQSPAAGTTAAGYCWTASLAVTRPGAWRCLAGNFIYDPCFATGSNVSTVICTKDPADPARSVRLSLTRPLPAEPPRPARTRAWALQLDDGAVCTYITGATGPVDGQRINYGCSNGWEVVGDPTPGPVWTVRTVLLAPRSLIVKKAAEAEVRTAWE